MKSTYDAVYARWQDDPKTSGRTRLKRFIGLKNGTACLMLQDLPFTAGSAERW